MPELPSVDSRNPTVCSRPHVHPDGTQPLEPRDLGGLVVRAQVDVQAVLDRLLLRDAQEEEVG